MQRLVVKGGSAFFEFGEEAEDLCPTSSLVTGPVRADDMLLLPSTWTHEEGLLAEAGIPRFWADTVPVISGTGANSVCSFSP